MIRTLKSYSILIIIFGLIVTTAHPTRTKVLLPNGFLIQKITRGNGDRYILYSANNKILSHATCETTVCTAPTNSNVWASHSIEVKRYVTVPEKNHTEAKAQYIQLAALYKIFRK